MKNSSGFTLLEIVLVLIIVGIITLFSTFGLIDVMKGYIQNRQYIESALKLNIAVSRIYRELKELHGIYGISSDRISYLRDDTHYAIALVDNEIKMSLNSTYPNEDFGYVLLDRVSSFNLSPKKSDGSNWTLSDAISDLGRIDVGITLDTNPPIEVSFSVNPWFNDTYNGPGS